jgi:CheY-like chemotaxis protein
VLLVETLTASRADADRHGVQHHNSIGTDAMSKATYAVPGDALAPLSAAVGNPLTQKAFDVTGEVYDLPYSVLVVEDNVIILMDTEEVLRELGVSEVFTATGCEEALALIAKQTPRFALLDVSLGSETSSAVATRLHELAIPFAFMTGYGDRRMLPPQFADKPCLIKPHSVEALKAILTSATAAP